jgi:hypothetical protein
MSRKELPRPGLVNAALAGRISNRDGSAALRITIRQFQWLKQRVRERTPLTRIRMAVELMKESADPKRKRDVEHGHRRARRVDRRDSAGRSH